MWQKKRTQVVAHRFPQNFRQTPAAVAHLRGSLPRSSSGGGLAELCEEPVGHLSAGGLPQLRARLALQGGGVGGGRPHRFRRRGVENTEGGRVSSNTAREKGFPGRLNML